MIILYHVSANAIYKIGTAQIFKPTKECSVYVDRYIDEMNKKEKGHPEIIVADAKVNNCRK